VARGSVQRRFLQRPPKSVLYPDPDHGVAETSPLSEIADGGRADDVIESVKRVAYAAAKATQATAPKATEAATAATGRIAGTPTHVKARRGAAMRPSQGASGGSEGVDRPAGGSIQNGLSHSLISQGFLPKGDPNRRFRRTLRNKRFFGASDPTADQRARSSCLRAAFECAFGYTRACTRPPIPHSPRFAICATGPGPAVGARSNCSRRGARGPHRGRDARARFQHGADGRALSRHARR
jgi:hypothetical protein